MANKPPQHQDELRLLYQVTVGNLTCFKTQQWSVTNYSVLLYAGTRDDYEEGERPCDALVAMWPATAREHATVRYVEGATHGFDSQAPARQRYDESARAGRGGMVNIIPSPKDAAEARLAVVSFFVKNLNP